VIARLDEHLISRQHVRAEPLPDGGVRVTNLSAKLFVRVENGPELAPQSALEVALPVVLVLGKKRVRIQEPAEEDALLHGLPEATLAPAVDDGSMALRFATAVLPRGGTDVEGLIRWMRVTMDVMHSAASPTEFLARAARAVVDLVGLDSSRVLLIDKGAWKEQHLHRRHTLKDSEGTPSRQVLNRVREEKRTFWQEPGPTRAQDSLVGVKAVVAAPILDRHGEVIGVLYGDRRRQGNEPRPLTRLDAMLVELLAGGLAAGLARVEMEQAALRARVQFEQFFTPELARELEANPDLLRGRDQEVTVLFADIRRFSHISARLGPAGTVAWINNVMGVLAACVREHGGVLVDYIGDELVAMWGAPKDQPDHARLACRAALAMRERLPQLQERWLAALKEPMDLGIGVNSGMACVGNIGSPHKFKYGPLGHTVNLASRVQGASKYLRTRLLITDGTQRQLGADFATRRLFRLRVVNIDEPVALYELISPGAPGWPELKNDYEEALQRFERQEFVQAARLLGNLLSAHPDDGPTLILLSRVVDCLREEPVQFDPVWQLPGK
jgi:adenylate cyclase